MKDINSILRIIDRIQPCSLQAIANEAEMERLEVRPLVKELQTKGCIKQYQNLQYVVTSTGKLRLEVSDDKKPLRPETPAQDSAIRRQLTGKQPLPPKSDPEPEPQPAPQPPANTDRLERLRELSTDELLEIVGAFEDAKNIIWQRVRDAGIKL